MTRLEAVNELLAGLGEPPVTALDTGGTSEAAEAEEYLDRAMREIVLEEWPQNADHDRTVPLPTHRLTITGSTGTFTWNEVITVGSVTGTFSHIETVSGTSYLYGAFTETPGTGTITGSTSGATRTVTAVLAVSSSKIGVGSDWTQVRASQQEYRRITVREGFLFDLGDLTYTFNSDVTLDIRRDGVFANMTDALQNYIVKKAAVLFQRYKKRGMADDQFLREQLIEAKVGALRERQDHRRTNILNTNEHYEISGGRLWHPVRVGGF